MNKEMAISKINKYGKIGKILTRILLVIAVFGVIATILSGIFLMTIPEDLIVFRMDNKVHLEIDAEEIDPEMSDADKERILDAFNSGLPTGLNLGAVSFSLDDGKFEDGKLIATSAGNSTDISLKSLGGGVLTAAVALVLTVISLAFGSKLCKAFEKCESPFEENVIKCLNRFAYSLLPWAVFSSIPQSIINSVINSSLKLSISLDFNIIFTVLIILALSIVFKYGAELQRESDETL